MAESTLGELGTRWFSDVIGVVTNWLREMLTDGYESINAELFGTTLPQTDGNFVLGTPTNGPWTTIHSAVVGGEITLLALLVLVCTVQAHHFLRIFSVGDSMRARRSKATMWTGVMVIVTWYWIATLALYLIDGFTIALLPPFEALEATMLDFLSVSFVNPVFGFIFAGAGGLTITAVKVALLLRQILLYVYLYGMPVILALKYGTLPVISRIAAGIARRFVPLALMPLPVALLFHVYGLLFTAEYGVSFLPDTALVSYLIAVSLPVTSIYIIWKLFRDAAPLATRTAGQVGSAVATGALIAGFGYTAGPRAAADVVRRGATATAAQTVAQRAGEPTKRTAPHRSSGTAQDNVVSDAYGQQGIPSYRRTENDPGYQ